MSGSVSVAKGWYTELNTLLNIFFFINLFIFLQVPHKFCCFPRAPAVRNLGEHVPPPALVAPAPMRSSLLS